MNKFILLGLFSFVVCLNTCYAQDLKFTKCECECFDTITVFIVGDFKGAEYRADFNGKTVFQKVLKGKLLDSFKVSAKDTESFKLRFYKRKRKYWNDLDLPIHYAFSQPYIIVYQDHRVKKKYELNYIYSWTKPTMCGTN